jgi:hypothetical protein
MVAGYINYIMGCYFGCGTCGARCSWAFWIILLLTGSAFIIAFGITAVGCGVEVVQCGEDKGLVLPAETASLIPCELHFRYAGLLDII